jgi:hypothetical protein
MGARSPEASGTALAPPGVGAVSIARLFAIYTAAARFVLIALGLRLRSAMVHAGTACQRVLLDARQRMDGKHDSVCRLGGGRGDGLVPGRYSGTRTLGSSSSTRSQRRDVRHGVPDSAVAGTRTRRRCRSSSANFSLPSEGRLTRSWPSKIHDQCEHASLSA